MSKKSVFLISLFVLAFLYQSCREDFDFPKATQPLRFSTTEIKLDTVFTNSKSSTYVLKVYNNESSSFLIPNILLKEEGSSVFRLNVEGKQGIVFNDILIREKDSLYVFVEVDAKDLSEDLMVEDEIYFDTQSGRQSIVLQAFVQDVIYLYPNPGEEEILVESNQSWSGKPIVVTKDLKVTNNSTLTLEQGLVLYFLSGKKLLVDKESQLIANGAINNPVLLRGSRQEPKYDSQDGQWSGVVLDTLASANLINTTIRSASTALQALEANSIELKNVQLIKNSQFGLLLSNSVLYAENLLANQNREFSIAILMGGEYDFVHCTIANQNTQGFGQKVPFFVSDVNQNNSKKGQLKKLNVNNSIVYGDAPNSVYFFFNSTLPFSYQFKHNLLKNEDKTTYDYSADGRFQNSITNQNPSFTNPIENDLKLLIGSPAIDAANPALIGAATNDFFGMSRVVNPDLGAIESN